MHAVLFDMSGGGPAEPTGIVGNSTFIDCLGGQWWAWLLGLGPILPSAHVSSTIANIMTANYVSSFDPSEQYPRQFFDQRDAGLFIARWGGQPPPSNALLYTAEGAWTGCGGVYVECFFFLLRFLLLRLSHFGCTCLRVYLLISDCRLIYPYVGLALMYNQQATALEVLTVTRASYDGTRRSYELIG